MPLSFMVIQSPLSSMCWATWACEASTSSSSGGVKSEANCTAKKDRSQKHANESVEGARVGSDLRILRVCHGVKP